jgi:hypothetical protein
MSSAEEDFIMSACTEVKDDQAGKLEAAGLWRRAAVRWLEVMQQAALSDGQREWIRLRRTYCLSRTTVPTPSGRFDVMALLRAVTAAEKRMGLPPDEMARQSQKRQKRRDVRPVRRARLVP